MGRIDSAKRVMNGTFTSVWLDSELVGEAYGLQAKMKFTKEKVQLCGQMATDSKMVAAEGTGSLKMRKVYSRMGALIGEKIRNGQDVRFELVSKIADPDAYGAERVCYKNVSFDDLTLSDFEAGKIANVEAPFTFTDYEYLDLVAPK